MYMYCIGILKLHWRLNMTEAEKITYETLLKSLREDSQHRTHHLDKLERFIAVVNIRINNAIPEGWEIP